MTDAIGSGSVFPDNIDHYPAGPELDAILAERVLGARVERYTEGWSGYQNWIATTVDGAELYILLSPHSVYGAAPLWNPSTNRLDAQMLVQHLYVHSDYRTMTDEVTEENGYSATLWALLAQRPVDNEVTGAGAGAGAGTGTGTGACPADVPQHGGTSSVTGTGPTPALAVCRAVYKVASGMGPSQMDPNNR